MWSGSSRSYPGPEEARFSVATYNVHGWRGRGRSVDLERSLEVIRGLEADLLVLQEATFHEDPASGPTPRCLARALSMEAFPAPTLKRRGAHFGNVLLTRLPVIEVKIHDLSHPRFEPRSVIEALLRIDGKPVQVIGTHFGRRVGERRAQASRILEILDGSPTQRVVLLGDFNEWTRIQRALNRIEREFAASPRLRTFPARYPLLSLDRIYVRPPLELLSVTVHRTRPSVEASDHLPLRAVVGMNRDSTAAPPRLELAGE